MDFTPDDAGTPAFPHDEIVDPYHQTPHLEWRTDDWDPALRFWTLPYDPQLTQWLTAGDPSLPSIMAAREFGGQPSRWQFDRAGLLARGWLELADVAWQPDQVGFPAIRAEIEELQMLMQDDRDRYLAESDVQADGLADYVIHFLGASGARHPWTIELISCGLAIGNIVYMHYKDRFKRVRPSFLCPGLIPPFGPPAHPAFPSGHSFLGHLIALLLLEIRGIAQRHGIFAPPAPPPAPLAGPPGVRPANAAALAGRGAIASPLLWLAQRLAKNRERIGVHYPSDSSGSRHLAAGIWWALLHAPNRIVCPTLDTALLRARAEWSTDWP